VIFSVIICPRCSYGAAKAEFSDNEDRCPRCDKKVLVPESTFEKRKAPLFLIKELLGSLLAFFLFFVALPAALAYVLRTSPFFR